MTALGYSHDSTELMEFALANRENLACWNLLSKRDRDWRLRGSPPDKPGYYIAQHIYHTMGEKLILPLPAIGEPFQRYRYAIYDYYGNLIEKDASQPKVVVYEYESDASMIHDPYYRYFAEKVTKPLDESDTVLPMSRYHDTVNIFNLLYGGFDFNALMRMIDTFPRHHEMEEKAYDAWVDEEFRKFFNEFCEYAGIHPLQVPDKVYQTAKDNYSFNMKKYMVNDYLDFFNYPVGIELRDGMVYELTGRQIFQDWATGFAIKSFAANVVGIQLAMEDAFSGRKRGFFEKIFQKRAIEHRRKQMSWDIHLHDKSNQKINIMDVVRFYPPPPGEPVENPLL